MPKIDIVSPYDISLQTVDIIIVKKDSLDNITHILLGKRNSQAGWRFPGGFVDVKDQSLEEAAKRELTEECSINLETNKLTYIGSLRIDDPRYRESPHKIMTAIFMGTHLFGYVTPTDDLDELKYFDFSDNIIKFLEPEHKKIFEFFKGKLSEKRD